MNSSKPPAIIMHKGIPQHIIYTITLIILLASVNLISMTSHADSMDNPVKSINELYTAMSQQILAHKTNEKYYIASDELLQVVSSKSTWDGFGYHYNPSTPLFSGCYTARQSFDGNISWFTTNNRTISVSFNYYVPKDTMNAYFEEMKKLASELKGENDFESVKNVHDYIINRVEYDHSNKGRNYTDIEGFRENRMVCQGYSMATFVLLSYMNIPCRMVTGEAGDEKDKGPHAWNIVQIDGKWYNYDVTWDDSEEYGAHYTFFLKSNEDFPMHYPEGPYANSDFTQMISTESYEMTNIINDKMVLWLLVAIALIVLIVFNTARKRG